MKLLFVIFSLITGGLIHGQILDINKPLFTDEPFFNQEFIKANKIKAIKGSRSSKKVQDIIRTKGLDFYYEFNDNGSLAKQLATFQGSNQEIDTNVINYEYHNNQLLSLIRKSDGYGYYSHRFFYDSLNQLIKQTYCREENACEAKNYFQLDKEYTINSDSFSYQKISDSQLKKLFYNNYNKVYKEQISYFNDLGYLTEDYSKFLIGSKKSRTTYAYDEKGRLSELTTTYLTKNTSTTEEYFYDDFDNILEIKQYKNHIYTTSKQFLYDKKTFLLTAQIIQDVETEFIRIVQYQYTFFDGESTSLSMD